MYLCIMSIILALEGLRRNHLFMCYVYLISVQYMCCALQLALLWAGSKQGHGVLRRADIVMHKIVKGIAVTLSSFVDYHRLYESYVFLHFHQRHLSSDVST